jgi:hypothetical protein
VVTGESVEENFSFFLKLVAFFFQNLPLMFDAAIVVLFLFLGTVDVAPWLPPYQKLNVAASLLCFRVVHSFAWLAVTDCLTRGISKALGQLMGLTLLTTLGSVIMALVGFK